jgi:hypothetical protein
MSYPYPQDRNRDRREKGAQPYKDARQVLTESQAAVQAEAEAFGESHPRETDVERMARLETEAETLLARVGSNRTSKDD